MDSHNMQPYRILLSYEGRKITVIMFPLARHEVVCKQEVDDL